jgi:hypothetical protein
MGPDAGDADYSNQAETFIANLTGIAAAVTQSLTAAATHGEAQDERVSNSVS